jgi:hypothetical protein
VRDTKKSTHVKRQRSVNFKQVRAVLASESSFSSDLHAPPPGCSSNLAFIVAMISS